MKTFFTSDTHFGHINIIKHCNRPFASVDEMNEKLIENWNFKVKKGDTVFHLGDFSFSPALPHLARLNGNVHLIKGNHEDKAEIVRSYFKSFHQGYLEIKVEGQKIVLCHYALRVWNQCHRGAWHLYGHSHGSLPELDNKSFDIGVDAQNYFPLSFEEVAQKMASKTFKPVDHHESNL